MPISVHLRTYTGETLAICSHPSINALCLRAHNLGLPGLGHVDPEDNTVFNRLQLRLLIPELIRLAQEAPTGEAEAARELLALTEQMQSKPHHVLLFNGD
ncbi:hypothetical protein F4556_006946 [Kitasatospora gansuensis]|uniref:Uncharacterized protein n=1 Tax=Kitasatospora gansuensis TaxID=258050 RepID=A0A7W7SJ48_9ACTN|nr:hypothetical protein [Kitasatospora gansuensis]MBB4951411.1 hypothetical protein [Kitasatospora gansuensis]